MHNGKKLCGSLRSPGCLCCFRPLSAKFSQNDLEKGKILEFGDLVPPPPPPRKRILDPPLMMRV